jgi:hypothetical protein
VNLIKTLKNRGANDKKCLNLDWWRLLAIILDFFRFLKTLPCMAVHGSVWQWQCYGSAVLGDL